MSVAEAHTGESVRRLVDTGTMSRTMGATGQGRNNVRQSIHSLLHLGLRQPQLAEIEQPEVPQPRDPPNPAAFLQNHHARRPRRCSAAGLTLQAAAEWFGALGRRHRHSEH